VTAGRPERTGAPSAPPRRRMTRAATVRAVVGNDLRRLARDRLALFFVAVLPFVLIVAIGSFIPAEDVDVLLAVVDDDGGPGARQLVDTLASAQGFELEQGLGRREAERDLRIQQVSAVLVVPEGFSDDLEAGAATVEVLVDPASASAALVRSELSGAIDEQAAVLTVERELAGAGAADPAGVAAGVVEGLERSEVEVDTLGTESGGSNFAFVAGGQMILFMFVNSLTAGAGFIEMRRLGVLGRALAGPVDSGDMLLGLGVSRFLVAGSLAVVITALASVVYDVDWGSLAVMGLVIVLFGIVCAGASTLIGAAFDAPDAAVSVGIPVGIGMAALGGCMFPLSLAPEPMQVAAHVLTPHAWAVDAILGSAYDGDGVAQLGTEFAVLALWAVVLLGLGRLMARRRMPGV
jgi:ABC-2 type transport system permease protein